MPTKNIERNAEIVRLKKAGKQPREIAKLMGMTRNAVIGVTNRAGLSSADFDQSDYMRELYASGEIKPNPPRGEAAWNAKLRDDDVLAIRRDCLPFSRTNGVAALAERFGVSVSCISHVVNGHSWAHVA